MTAGRHRRGRAGATAVLWLALLLVLASAGMLVTALVTSTARLAWGSVAASAAAGGLLVADRMRRRRAGPGSGAGSAESRLPPPATLGPQAPIRQSPGSLRKNRPA
ncbi:MAG TPA: hypothetical protein VGJ95_01560 [Pseudonocardiaceae bacterium]